jgi:membrane protease YdiL (CAAX protease family)
MSMQSSSFSMKHPYWFTALILLAIILVYLASGTAVAMLKLPTGDLYFIANVVLTLLGTGLLTGWRFWKGVGFHALSQSRDLLLYWLPAVPILINLMYGVAVKSAGSLVYFLILAAMVGFVEEVFFRGLILRAIAPRGAVKAVVISSVVFGLVHSMNVLGGSNGFYTLLQIGYALAIGLSFAAITLRTHVLWPLVIIHALIDFASFIASGRVGTATLSSLDVVIAALVTVSFIAYAIYLMRPSRKAIVQVVPAQ